MIILPLDESNCGYQNSDETSLEDFEKSKSKIYLSKKLSTDKPNDCCFVNSLFDLVDEYEEDNDCKCAEHCSEQTTKPPQQKLIIQHADNSFNNTNKKYIKTIPNKGNNILNVKPNYEPRKTRYKGTSKNSNNAVKYRHSKFKAKTICKIRD